MFTPDIPENKYKVPLIQKSELPTYSFNKLVDMCEFNHIDEMDVHLGDKHGTRYCYVENVLKRPLELREFLIYSGQSQFYRDMMKERTRIAQERFRIAKKQAEDKRFWIDMSCIIAGVLASVGIIFWVISFFIS